MRLKPMLLAVCVATAAASCAPIARVPMATPIACSVAVQSEQSCAPAVKFRSKSEMTDQDSQQRRAHDIGTWLILLTMGFAAIYFMHFH